MKTEPIQGFQDFLEKTRNRISEAEVQAAQEGHGVMVVAVTGDFLANLDLATMVTIGQHFMTKPGIAYFAGHKLKILPGAGSLMLISHWAG